jgi:hypothetical protein
VPRTRLARSYHGAQRVAEQVDRVHLVAHRLDSSGRRLGLLAAERAPLLPATTQLHVLSRAPDTSNYVEEERRRRAPSPRRAVAPEGFERLDVDASDTTATGGVERRRDGSGARRRHDTTSGDSDFGSIADTS